MSRIDFHVVGLMFVLSLMVPVCSFAQGWPMIEWQRCYGGTGYDDGYSISPRPEGGFLLGATATSQDGDVSVNPGTASAWVIAIEEDGSIEWERCYGNMGAVTQPVKVTTAQDGGFYLATTIFEGGGDIQCNPIGYTIWLIKADPIGTVQWQVCIGGSGSDFFQDMTVLTNGDLVIAGSSYSSDGHAVGSQGGTDALLARLTPDGDILWTHCYGGSENEGPYAITETADGGLIVVGGTRSSDGMLSGVNSAPSNNTMAWIFKVDGIGTSIWHKVYGGSGEDRMNCVLELPSGSLIAAGMTRSSDGDVSGYLGGASDGWTLLMNGSGDLQIQRPMGGSSAESIQSLVATSNQNILFVGYTTSNDNDILNSQGGSDVWAFLLNEQLDFVWSGTYGGSDHDYGTAISVNNSAYLLGRTFSSDGDVVGQHGQSDVWVVKLAPWDDTGLPPDHTMDPLQIFPNPAGDQLWVRHDAYSLAGLPWTVTDLTGRTLLHGRYGAQQNMLSVEGLSPGAYHLLVGSGAQQVTARFIKQ